MILHDKDIVDIRGQVWNNGWDQVWEYIEGRLHIHVIQLGQKKLISKVRRQVISD